MRIRSLIALIVLSSLTLGGCHVSGELENQAYVLVLGIDRAADGQLLLTARVPQIGKGKPVEESGGGDYLAFSANGADWPHALDALERATPRQMNLSHIGMIVVSEALAKEEGFGELIARIAETPHLYTTARFAVCAGQASEFIGAMKTVIGTRLSSEISAMLDHYVQQGFVPDGIFADACYLSRSIYGDPAAILCLLMPGEAPAVSMIDPIGSPDAGIQSPMRQRYEGAALFRQGRMVGTLDAGQTRLLNLIRGSIEALPFECDGKAFTLTTEGRPHLSVDLEDGGAALSLRVRLTTLDDVCAEDARRLEARLASSLIDVIRECQRLGAEPFGFSEAAAGHFATVPDWLASDWREQYRRANVTVQVEIHSVEAQ